MFIYLSPHYDDICFSLGGLVSKVRQGTVLNLFTTSKYAKPHVLNQIAADNLAGIVSQIRSGENDKYAASNNLATVSFNLEDASLHDGAFDEGNRAHDASAVRENLKRTLIDDESYPQGSTLFCPLGIGGHTNHLSTFDAVCDLYDDLNKRYKVVFYEDVPYTFYPGNREKRLAEVSEFMKSKGLTRHVCLLEEKDIDAKREGILLFGSQLSNQNIDMAKYIITTPECSRPHEAYWAGFELGLGPT